MLTLGFVQIALLERSELRAVFVAGLLKRRLARKTHHLRRLTQKRFIDKITILIPWSAELNSVSEVYRLTFERYLNRLALKEAGHCGCAEKLLSATAKNRAFVYYRQRFSKIKTDPALRSGSTWLELREAFCNFWEANKEYVETGIRKECGDLDETDLTFGEVTELFGLNQLNVVWVHPENIKLCRQYRISFKVLTRPTADSLDAVGLLVELKRYVKAGALYDAEKLADRLLKLAPQNRLALIVKAELALESGESEPNLLRLKSLLESESYPLRLFAFLKSYYRWTGDLKGLEYLSNLEPELTRRQEQASRAGELEIWNRIHPLPPSDPSCSALLAYVKSNPVIYGLWAGRKRVGATEVTHFRIFCRTGTPETMKSELVEQAQATVDLAGGGEFVVDVWPKFLLRVMPRLKKGVIPIGPGSIGRSD